MLSLDAQAIEVCSTNQEAIHDGMQTISLKKTIRAKECSC